MDRDWSYFALIAIGVIVLWVWHRRRLEHHRGLTPIVLAILAVILALYIFIAE